MKDFNYFNPVKVKFGAGIKSELGKTLKNKYKRVLLVCSRGPFHENGLYDFVKHLSDKRGAHIDIASSILIPIFNKPGKGDFSLVECLALQMIVAAEKQIPELSDYWPESLKAIEGI